MSEQSPYMTHPKRLADIIAAIQLMGTYKFGSRSVENWEKSIGRPPLSAENWTKIFDDHPEFFRVKDGFGSLVWRRAKKRNHDTVSGRDLSTEELKALDKDAKGKLTRRPLDPSQVEALMNSAIKMHSSAIAHNKELRWMVPTIASLSGVVVGAYLRYLFS